MTAAGCPALWDAADPPLAESRRGRPHASCCCRHVGPDGTPVSGRARRSRRTAPKTHGDQMSRSPWGRLARSAAHARSVGAAVALRVWISPDERQARWQNQAQCACIRAAWSPRWATPSATRAWERVDCGPAAKWVFGRKADWPTGQRRRAFLWRKGSRRASQSRGRRPPKRRHARQTSARPSCGGSPGCRRPRARRRRLCVREDKAALSSAEPISTGSALSGRFRPRAAPRLRPSAASLPRGAAPGWSAKWALLSARRRRRGARRGRRRVARGAAGWPGSCGSRGEGGDCRR